MTERYYHEYNFDDFDIANKFQYKMKDCDFLIVEPSVGFKEGEEKEIQCLEIVLSNGVSDNIFIEERVLLNCTRDMLSLIHFSFNNAVETDLNNFRELVIKHIKIVQDAVDNQKIDYIKEIMSNFFENSRIFYFVSCDESKFEMEFNKDVIKTIDDVSRVLNCYNKRYNTVRKIFRS